MEKLTEICEAVGAFAGSTLGWCVTAFLIGVIAVCGVWMWKHPEDFFTIEDEEPELWFEEIDR